MWISGDGKREWYNTVFQELYADATNDRLPGAILLRVAGIFVPLCGIAFRNNHFKRLDLVLSAFERQRREEKRERERKRERESRPFHSGDELTFITN